MMINHKAAKNYPFWFNTTTELKTKKNYKQTKKHQNTIKVNTLKAIPNYYNEVLVVRTFFFCSFPKYIFFTYATIAFNERYVWMFRVEMFEASCFHISYFSLHSAKDTAPDYRLHSGRFPPLPLIN